MPLSLIQESYIPSLHLGKPWAEQSQISKHHFNTPASILTERNYLSALLKSQMTSPSQAEQAQPATHWAGALSQAPFACSGVSLTKQVLGCGKAPSWQKLIPPLNTAIWPHLPGSLSVQCNTWQLLVPIQRRVSPVTFKLHAWLSQ